MHLRQLRLAAPPVVHYNTLAHAFLFILASHHFQRPLKRTDKYTVPFIHSRAMPGAAFLWFVDRICIFCEYRISCGKTWISTTADRISCISCINTVCAESEMLIRDHSQRRSIPARNLRRSPRPLALIRPAWTRRLTGRPRMSARPAIPGRPLWPTMRLCSVN